MDNNQDLGAFASTVPQKENDLGAFASAVPAAPSPVARIAKDAGIAAARGIVGAPEALIGLADIPTGGAIGRLAEQAGIKTKETKNILADYYSPEYKAAQEKVNTAEGFVPTVVAAAQNPSTIGNAAIESVPSMLVGGAIGRMARAGMGAATISPVVAGAVGEGAVSAGQTAEQVRQESPSGFLTPQQAALAAGSGALTGGINLVGGKIAQKLGIADVDTLLAGGAGQAGTKGVLRRVGEGALSEGLLQEAPQSYQEQVAQNLAQGLPATQGAANAAAQGALAGGLMGGGANIPGPITGAAAKAAPEVPGESIPIKTMDAAQARANRMATETGTPFEVVPHPTVGGSFTVVPAAEAENGKPGAGAGTENGRLPAAANAVMDAAVQPANVPANDGAGGSGIGDSGRNQPVDAGRAAGTEVQPDRVSGNPADAGLAIGANDVALPPPGGPIEAAARLAQQAAPAAPVVQQEEAPRAPQPITLQDGTVVMPTNVGAGKINPAEPASLRMQSGFDLAAQDSANSILNERKLSTPAQQAANNAKLGEADFQGLTIKVENPQGSVRQGVAEDKTPWATLMTEHYGYIKGTKGADAAGVDTFVGPNPQSDKAFVVDQSINGKFDEHKVMLGFDTLDQAKAAYADNYQPGWKGGENISETTVGSLKDWLKNGETNQPFSAAQEASQASQQGEVVPPSTPAVAEAQAANVVPPEAAVPAMMKFKSVAAALKYAKDNNINAVAVKNASGKVILAPVKPLDPTFSRQQANKDVADLNEGLKSEGVTVKPVHTLTVEQRIIQAVAEKAFGTKMTYVSDNPVFSGVAYKGKVYVSASEKQALIPVAFHEVSHFLQTADKKIAGELQDFMAGYIRQGVVADRQSMENELAPEGRKIDRQGAVNEVLADIGGAVAVDPNFWRKMAEHDESLFRKVAYKMMQLMTKAIQIARGSHFDIDRMVTDRAAVQTAIAKAWGQYNSNRDKGVYDAKADAGTVREIAGGQQTTAARVQEPAGVRRSNRILDAASGQNNRLIPLRGLPAKVIVDGKSVTFGPFAPAREAAASYRKKAGIKTLPQREYVKVDPVRAKAIAAEFEDMKHDPNDPKVKASYDAMIKETLAQYQEIKATGLKIELITGADPYGNPRNAILDVINNNHLWVYPTTSGFGGTESANVDITGNPLLAPVDEKIGDHQLVANDIFRVVHDYFGHIKEGVGFRAEGEENAWQQHATMYSDLARPAMTTETRGQNSWVNFGPYSEFNKTANGAETQYAPQKVGLMDDWTMTSGGPQFSRTPVEALDEVRTSDPVSIKPQQPDAAAPVTAVHYGKTAGLDVLSGDMNSKGIYGREQERLKYSDDPAIKRRVYFYPANEGGMPVKEGGLGINAYATKFGNLYDAAKDPQGLRAQVKGIADPADRSNAFESAIVKAGYDGYATGKMIVALDSNVPVTFLGQQSMRFNRKQQKTEAFKTWFDGSKVVNKNGDPLIVYHGTASDFSEFSKDKIVRKAAGEGFYFTSNKEQGGYSEGDGANVMPVYLDIKNPTTNPMLFKNDKSYDGLMYDLKSDPGVTHYAVREPNQIKSAIGNAGTFDAANDDIRFNRTPPDWINQVPGMTPEIAKKVGLWVPEKTLKERFNELKQDLGKKMVQGMVDQFAPIKELDMKAYMQARLSKASDGGLEAMLMYGKLGMDADGAITVGNTGGFIDSMKKLGVEQERFFSWVAGNRAAELKANGKENLFTDTDISALKNLNQGTTVEGKNRTTLYSEVLKDLNGFSKSILDIAEKSGLIDGNERHKWEKDFYVPFYRVLEDDGKAVGPRNLAGLTNQYAFKKLKGGKDNLNDLMQNTVMNWAHLLSASLKNQAATTTLDAAQRIGVAHNVTSSTKGSVFVLKGGKEMHYVVDDPFITDAISSLAFSGMKGAVIDIATKAKRMLSFGVTFGPTYKLRNIIRDQLQAVSANPMSLNVAKNLADGVKYSSKDNPLYAQMLAGGGLFRMGAAYEDNRAQHLKNLVKKLPAGSIIDSTSKLRGVANKAYDAWMELGDRGETITRAAIYSQMVANGASHLEASYNTRDSMDFGLQGAWPAVRLLTQTVPFMNARMQGLYKLGRAAKEDPRRFATVLGATSIATIALMLASRDDEDWKRREEWDRDNFWWFKVGGNAIRIPKPFEIGAMASVAERGLDMILEGMDEKSRARFGSRLYHIVMDNLSMNPVPQLVKPALDLYSNKDPFRLRAIETPGMEKMSKQERIGGNTTGMAVMLGKAGVLSPVQIDYIISGYFGWLGSHLAMAADPLTRPAMGLPEKAERKIDDAFFVGDWVKELPSNQSRYVEEFYRQAKDVREAMADMAHYKKLGNIDKAKEILTDKKDLIMQGKKFALATTNINRLNLRIQQVQASSKMDAKQKRTEVDRLSEMRNKIAERVMK